MKNLTLCEFASKLDLQDEVLRNNYVVLRASARRVGWVLRKGEGYADFGVVDWLCKSAFSKSNSLPT